MILFGEFLDISAWGYILLAFSVIVITCGVLLIVLSSSGDEKAENKKELVLSLLGALGSGIF